METKHADLSSLKINRSGNYTRTSSGKKKLLIFSLIIIILSVLAFAANLMLNGPVEVKTVTAVMQSPAQTNTMLTASGYVVAQRKAAIASKGTGRLIYLGVVEGDEVQKDQVIARLEDNDIRAQLDEARANLSLSMADLKDTENNLNRQKELFKTGSTSQAILDESEARYARLLANIDIAKARVNAAEVALENTLIRAPFSGTVLSKNAEIGEIVAPFAASASSRAAVVTVADMKSLQVEADVSESNIEKIALNQDCEIILDAYPEKSYPGYVFKIVPTADRSKATVMVKIGFRKYDSSVLPEMSSKVSFLSAPADTSAKASGPVLIVPLTAVKSNGGGQFVFKVKDGKAEQVNVTAGRRFGSYVEITSGLTAGERVIENAGEEIQPGTDVKEI